MTEEEWLAEQTDAHRMISYLEESAEIGRSKAGKRRLRLFACGCCRMVWHLLDDASLRPALEVAERCADREENLSRLRESASAARLVSSEPSESTVRGVATNCAAHMIRSACDARARMAAYGVAAVPAAFSVDSISTVEGTALHCHLLRDVFGNPFHPAVMKRAWVAANDRAAEAVARSIYDERAFDRMPILADALEDAGCGDEAILAHCRGPGPHVRGCWVVDAILGKG